MGARLGHIIPGTFFVSLAFWWHVNNCLRYLKSLPSDNGTRNEQTTFRGSTTYPCFCVPFNRLRRLPIESIIKILVLSIEFIMEIYSNYTPSPRPYINEEATHHMAMFFGFFLGACIEILVHYKVPLPPRINQVMGTLSFAIETLMMVFHLHARSTVDTHVHRLLALTMAGSMIGALGECFHPDNCWFIIGRSFFALTQGTWIVQIAFVLWPKTTNPLFIWDMDSHRSVSLLTMSFAYHLAGNAVLLILIYLLIYVASRYTSILNVINDSGDERKRISEYKLTPLTNEEDINVHV